MCLRTRLSHQDAGWLALAWAFYTAVCDHIRDHLQGQPATQKWPTPPQLRLSLWFQSLAPCGGHPDFQVAPRAQAEMAPVKAHKPPRERFDNTLCLVWATVSGHGPGEAALNPRGTRGPGNTAAPGPLTHMRTALLPSPLQPKTLRAPSKRPQGHQGPCITRPPQGVNTRDCRPLPFWDLTGVTFSCP